MSFFKNDEEIKFFQEAVDNMDKPNGLSREQKEKILKDAFEFLNAIDLDENGEIIPRKKPKE